MPCGGCGAKRNRERWIVEMPNGLEVVKPSKIQAQNYAEKHPGPDGRPAKIRKAGV